MLKISKMADYAIVIAHHMAGKPEKTVSAADIATATHISLPTVSNILKALTKHGLFTSQRGAAGGYGLTRSPADISIADIITAIEGPIQLTECSHNNEDNKANSCDKITHCQITENWRVINQAVTGVLENLSLRDLQTSVTEHPIITNNIKPMSTE